MKDIRHVQVESRAQWRAWLTESQTQTERIWLVTFKKNKGPYVSYNDIVDEGICFGWIDSRVAKLDDVRSMLLLSPRREGSAWSKVNKDRVERAIKAGLMTLAGQKLIDNSKLNGRWDELNDVDALIEPEDLNAALNHENGAWQNWDRFPPSSRRGILEWINAAKREATRQTRIQQTALLAAQGIKANFPEGRNRLSKREK